MRVRGLKLLLQYPPTLVQQSHPVRVRGLKRALSLQCCDGVLVAPRAGAWVETQPGALSSSSSVSHPVRVRGLKLRSCRYENHNRQSHPVRVRGLKQGLL